MKVNLRLFLAGIVLIASFSYLLKIGIFRAIITPRVEPTKKVSVVTSFYPLYFFASQIGGDKASVFNITPAGSEPHDYTPATMDIYKIEKSDIFILNGGNFEPWAEKIVDNLQNKRIVLVTPAQDLVTEEIVEGGKHIKDPHVWLSPQLAKKMLEPITNAFTFVDRRNEPYYLTNKKQLEDRLDQLDDEYKQNLKDCRLMDIITSHSAFGYLAKTYGLKQIPISGLSPDEEPSPQQLAQVTAFTRDNSVKYIFFETFVSPRLSETVAREIGAKTLVLNPLEGLTKEEEKAGKDYFSIQKENLENLKIALECK